MKLNDNIAYAPLPRELKGRRNMVPAGSRNKKGRFRSGKSHGNEVRLCPDIFRFAHVSMLQPDPETPTWEYNDSVIPRIYRKVEIEYSKFGVEDFDFGQVYTRRSAVYLTNI
jgi:PAB-dependent poly(A)-specific ribonuclease subunit 2